MLRESQGNVPEKQKKQQIYKINKLNNHNNYKTIYACLCMKIVNNNHKEAERDK